MPLQRRPLFPGAVMPVTITDPALIKALEDMEKFGCATAVLGCSHLSFSSWLCRRSLNFSEVAWFKCIDVGRPG